jgi:hypothetical protein
MAAQSSAICIGGIFGFGACLGLDQKKVAQKKTISTMAIGTWFYWICFCLYPLL